MARGWAPLQQLPLIEQQRCSSMESQSTAIHRGRLPVPNGEPETALSAPVVVSMEYTATELELSLAR